jgi:carbon-monoxide dehydrogenase medium subunit
MIAYDHVEPGSVEEVVAALAEHGDDAHLIAGGASLVLMLRQQLLSPRLLVGLRRVEALRGIREGDGGLEIGAMTTHREIERSPLVDAHAPALAETVGHVATVRIRNQGTIGGNLAHADPAQDPPPMLLALDAVVVVRGPAGAREIPIGDLFVDYFETSLDPGEVITAVRIPPRAPGHAAAYRKYLPGSQDDYATVAVAVAGRRTDDGWRDLRLAVGAAGPIPMRVPDAERLLEGTPLPADAVAEAADLVRRAVDPIDDVRGSAAYKREMAGVFATRALRDLADGRAP